MSHSPHRPHPPRPVPDRPLGARRRPGRSSPPASAAAQSGGWLLVRAAIDDGIAKGDEHTLTVVVDLLPGAERGRLGLPASRSSAGSPVIGQGIVLGLRRDLFDHLTSLSLRYFSEQRAGWIIARLTSDVDAISDALSQGLPTLVVEHRPPADDGDRALHRRLAAGARRDGDPAAGAGARRAGSSASRRSPSSRCETASPRSRPTWPSRWRAWRSCRRSTASAQFQGAVRRAERARTARANVYAQTAVLGVLPVDRAAGGDLDLRRARRRRAVPVGGHAHDRHADHGHLPAAARVPAAAGAVRRVRPDAVGGRRDGQDQLGARRRARDRRSPRRRPDAADRRPPSISTRSASPTARRRCCTTSDPTCRPAAASPSSARRAAASRRWPS